MSWIGEILMPWDDESGQFGFYSIRAKIERIHGSRTRATATIETVDTRSGRPENQCKVEYHTIGFLGYWFFIEWV